MHHEESAAHVSKVMFTQITIGLLDTTKEPNKYIIKHLPVGVPWFNMVSQSCSILSQFYAAQRLGQDSGGFRSETEILPEPPHSPEQNMEILATEIVNLGAWGLEEYGSGEGLVVLSWKNTSNT